MFLVVIKAEVKSPHRANESLDYVRAKIKKRMTLKVILLLFY